MVAETREREYRTVTSKTKDKSQTDSRETQLVLSKGFDNLIDYKLKQALSNVECRWVILEESME